MYILYKQNATTNPQLIGAQRVSTALDYVVAKIDDAAIPYNDLDALDATILTEEQADGCKFAFVYKDFVNVKRGSDFAGLVSWSESMEDPNTKIPYYLTDTDWANAVSFLKVLLKQIAKEYYNVEFNKINSRVPTSERELFLTQRQEAQAHLADSSSPTPLLSALAEAKGLTLQEMVDKVLQKIQTYEEALRDLVVRQKTVEKEINECVTLKELHYLAARRFAYSAYAYEYIHGATDVPQETLDL